MIKKHNYTLMYINNSAQNLPPDDIVNLKKTFNLFYTQSGVYNLTCILKFYHEYIGKHFVRYIDVCRYIRNVAES